MKILPTLAILLFGQMAAAQIIDTSNQRPVHVPTLIISSNPARLNGWIGYTTSRTESLFAPVNNYNWFPAVSDRIHDFSFLGIYRLSSRWSLSGNLIESNGNLVNLAPGHFGNSYATPGTKRVDISATFDGQLHKTYQNAWSVGIYNLNGYWKQGPAAGILDTRIIARPVTSFSWNIKLR